MLSDRLIPALRHTTPPGQERVACGVVNACDSAPLLRLSGRKLPPRFTEGTASMCPKSSVPLCRLRGDNNGGISTPGTTQAAFDLLFSSVLHFLAKRHPNESRTPDTIQGRTYQATLRGTLSSCANPVPGQVSHAALARRTAELIQRSRISHR